MKKAAATDFLIGLIIFLAVLGFAIWFIGFRVAEPVTEAGEEITKVDPFKDFDEDGIMNKDDKCCPAACKTDPALVERSGPRMGCAPNQKELTCNSLEKDCLI